MSTNFPILPKKSQGVPPEHQKFQQRPDQEKIEKPSKLTETATNPSFEIENFALPRFNGENVDVRQRESFQRRKRALLTAEKARGIFKLRGRLAASERETGNFSSLFTARSELISQVIYLHISQRKNFRPCAVGVAPDFLLANQSVENAPRHFPSSLTRQQS
jgi:hypothetical protein